MKDEHQIFFDVKLPETIIYLMNKIVIDFV
jgi:hypothetical protein